MIIALSGTPGTGKSVVGKLLARTLNFKAIELGDLAEKTKAYCGYDRSRRTKIVDVSLLAKEVKKMKGNLILISHFSQDMPSDLTIVLRCEITELGKRLEKRGWSKRKREENIQAEIFNVCREESRGKVLEIDTTKKTAKKVVSEILFHLGKGIKA